MMKAAPMASQTAQQSPCDPWSAAAYPRWVMFEQDMKIHAEGSSSSSSTSGDSKTLAAAHTSTGHLIQVSLNLAEPPAVSCVCVHIPAGIDGRDPDSQVIAAHGDSVLIEVNMEEKHPQRHTRDDFVYTAGDAAADPPRPPSLSLLPPNYLTHRGTGLVRRHGDDKLVVAHLQTVLPGTARARREPNTNTPEPMTKVAELSLFRDGEWNVRRLQVMFRNASEVRELPSFWNAVVPVGDGLLCWVDLRRLGVVICNVFEETPKLRYLPLPKDTILGKPSNRNVCATAGGSALKFVNVFPRCCCGDAGASCCKRSNHAYTIHTWTMKIGVGDDDDDDNIGWVKDGMVDATELWTLESYKGLRRLPLNHPAVSLDDPELICFWMHEPPVDSFWEFNNESVDLLMVNMRSKTIHSVSRHQRHGLLHLSSDGLIPSNVSSFFNSSPCSGSDDGTLIARSKKKSIEWPPTDIVDDEQLVRGNKRQRTSNSTTNPTLQPAASIADPSIQATEIFEAFQEIPSYGLNHDETIKAYSILSRDNGRRFTSFIRLPKNMRRDWLSMEIKASDD